jgi:betaine-aldehyde dehydrogenase
MIVGQWINGRGLHGSGDPIEILNPASGEVVAQMLLASPDDVAAAVAAAKDAFPGWSTATPGERSTVLHDLAARMSASALRSMPRRSPPRPASRSG